MDRLLRNTAALWPRLVIHQNTCATNIVVSLWLMHLPSCSCTLTVKVAKYRIGKLITFVI